jgi:hypothetical protein
MTDQYDVLFMQLLRQLEDLDRVCTAVRKIKGKSIKIISVAIPKFVPHELGFIRLISWLYVLYFEAGRVDCRFLKERLSGFGLDGDGTFSRHYDLINKLRTYLQHNLNSTEEQDYKVKLDCEQWFRETCKTVLPNDETHWAACLKGLLLQAKEFISILKRCALKIDEDENPDVFLNEWELRYKRYLAPNELDMLIKEITDYSGRDNIDPVKFRKKYQGQWNEELSLRYIDCDFREETRRLIEYTLSTQTVSLLPISGLDIMRELNIPKGPQVGDLLEFAHKIYSTEKLSRDLLLDRLRRSLN